MNRRVASTFALTATALIASAAFAAKPSPAVVTLGSDLAAEPDIFMGCGNPCLRVQDVLPGRTLVSPVDGVIVRWRARVGAGTDAQSIRIRVVRRFDADHFTAISSGSLEPIPAGAGTHAFPARLPIRSGDQVAAESTPEAEIVWGATVVGAHFLDYSPSPPDGGITPNPGPAGADTELTINADVEADGDQDGFGDETQDQCPTSAATQGPCPTSAGAPTGQQAAALKKCKKKKSKKARRKCRKRAKKLPV